jgi:hypothetical protein
MTFFWAIAFVVPLATRVNVVNLHVTIFRASEFENAYCALISSPSFGIVLSGGSTRSINRPCAIEFTMAATSASNGSLGFDGTYSCTGSPYPGVAAPARDAGRDRVVRGVDESLKLEGGNLPGNVGRAAARPE